MVSPHPIHARNGDDDHGRSRSSPSPLETALERLDRTESRLATTTERLDRTEARLRLLEGTLHGIGRMTGIAVGCPCNRCERSLLLIRDGMFSCPAGGYRQSL